MILDIYNRYVNEIQKGIKGVETDIPLLPHDAVAGSFVEDMELHQYEGVLTEIGEGNISGDISNG